MTTSRNRIAIAGAGKVGRYVANDLNRKGHEVVLIEQDADKAAALQKEVDVSWIIGDACELHTLDEAVLSSCDVMVAATGDDEDNLVISLLAKQEFAVPRVVARVNYPDNAWLFTETWGVDVPVSTPHLLTSMVEEAVSVGELVTLFSLEQGKVGLLEVTLADESPASGKTIGDLNMPPDCTIVAVVRDRHVIAPTPDTPLEVGDEVLALATPASEPDLQRALAGDA
jgi:trk system potassium uptake protein TrkA